MHVFKHIQANCLISSIGPRGRLILLWIESDTFRWHSTGSTSVAHVPSPSRIVGLLLRILLPLPLLPWTDGNAGFGFIVDKHLLNNPPCECSKPLVKSSHQRSIGRPKFTLNTAWWRSAGALASVVPTCFGHQQPTHGYIQVLVGRTYTGFHKLCAHSSSSFQCYTVCCSATASHYGLENLPADASDCKIGSSKKPSVPSPHKRICNTSQHRWHKSPNNVFSNRVKRRPCHRLLTRRKSTTRFTDQARSPSTNSFVTNARQDHGSHAPQAAPL